MDTTLHNISNTITTSSNQRQSLACTITIALDMSNAFDIVNIHKLINKFIHTNIFNTFIKNIANYINWYKICIFPTILYTSDLILNIHKSYIMETTSQLLQHTATHSNIHTYNHSYTSTKANNLILNSDELYTFYSWFCKI